HTRWDTFSGCFTRVQAREVHSTHCPIHPSALPARLLRNVLTATNLMFPSDFLTGQMSTPLLTPNQQFVILRNPLVSQPPESGVQTSVSVGSFALVAFPATTPITVNVPPAAGSLNFVTLFEYTRKTVRGPKAFPTIRP